MEHIPAGHPREASLRLREALVKGFREGLVAQQGLLAHGRGEAFDYLLGEATTSNARRAVRAAAALLLTAKRPVLSVNGNLAALCPNEIAELEREGLSVEVNLFYREGGREEKIAEALRRAGVKEVLGVDEEHRMELLGLRSERRWVDRRGLGIADVVLLAMEDGDRTEALRREGRRVIAIDLNPLSRTARMASITIVDNVVRALPLLVDDIRELKSRPKEELLTIGRSFDNAANLREALSLILRRLEELGAKGLVMEP